MSDSSDQQRTESISSDRIGYTYVGLFLTVADRVLANMRRDLQDITGGTEGEAVGLLSFSFVSHIPN
jgi:hypothetical protein